MFIRHPVNAIRRNEAISFEELRRVIPSAFAEEAHESRSSRYTFIPTVAVLKGLAKEGFLPYAASQQRTRDEGKRDFTRHVIRLRHAGLFPQAVGDVVPEICIMNSHDGTSSYKLMAGLFRLVCTNGLVVSDTTCADVTVRHSGNIVDNVIEGAFEVLDSTKTAIEASRQYAGIALSAPEQEVFGRAAAQLRWGDESPVEGSQVVAPRRRADAEDTLWHTFNRAQENIMRGGQRGRTSENRRTTTREIKGVSENIRLNKALWTLADEMAKLKAA